MLALAVAGLTGCAPFNQVRLQSGSLGFLKQQQIINVEYDYTQAPDSLAWLDSRATRFQPKFEELLNKQLADKSRLRFAPAPESAYTLVLKTQDLQPGWNAFISARPALLTAEAVFVETGSRANTLATVTLVNMTGMDAVGVAFDDRWRMQEAYAKAGKELGILIRKKIK